MFNSCTQLPFEEPQWGKDLLIQTNEAFVANDFLVSIAPLLADGVVLLYPILLLVWYIWGLRKGHEEMRYGALYVFFSAVSIAVLNIIIQLFIDKQRPEGYIDNTDMLVMDHLPTAPFPSDHAGVGAAVAVAVLLWSYRNNYKPLQAIGWFLLIGALVMSWARVGVGIHWPTDVIVGTLLGALVAWGLHSMLYRETWVRKCFTWLIGIQEWLFGHIGRK